MSFEEEFDKIIRQKAEEAKYPFEESNWEKTSRMLDTERQASRALKFKKFYLPGVLCLAIGSVGMLIYSYTNTIDTREPVLAINSIQKDLGQSADQNVPARSNELKITSPQNEPNLTIKETGNEHENSSAGIPLPATEKASLPAPAEKNNVQAERNSDNVSATTQTNIQPEQKTKEEEDVKEERTIASNSNADANEIKSGKTNPPQTTGPVTTLRDENSAFSGNSAPAEKDQLAGQTQDDQLTFQNKEASLMVDQLQADHLKALYLDLPVEMNDPELMPTQFSFLSRYDEDYYNNGKKSKTHSFNAELGGTYLLGWNASGSTDAKGINYFGGFNYGLYLSKKVSIGIGVQAYNISNIGQPFYSTKRKEYDFGSTGVYTVVTSNDLYYAAIPLKLNYAINAFNIIGLGLNAGYLLGSRNTIRTYNDNREQPFVGAPVTTKGIYENTRTANMMLSAHYKMQICQRVGVNAEFIYGMTDIFNNTGEIKNAEKPVGFRLSLQYTLFDK